MNSKSPRKKVARPGNRNRRPSSWQLSRTFAAIGVAALRKFQKNRQRYQKCGAHAKSTGQPCRNLAGLNGRCRLHGGATPGGPEWGRRQLPKPKPKGKQKVGDWAKIEEKLRRREKDDQDRVRRLRAMSNDAFYSWVRRMGRRLNDPFAPLLKKAVRAELARRGPDPSTRREETAAPAKTTSQEHLEIEARIAELRAELARRDPKQRSSK